jgi:hypothetical protein
MYLINSVVGIIAAMFLAGGMVVRVASTSAIVAATVSSADARGRATAATTAAAAHTAQ